ncbi:MAG: hypothetical protein H6719_38235, partial [Sandaracinaceae bacterium]|nr:hypothetical protein [Sandaracinaceae bacterium]
PDCDDPDCAGAPTCCVPSPEICDDRLDNDCDRQRDCADPDCRFDPACADGGVVTVDGGVMCIPAEGVLATCTDGLDNDCDGPVDCGDPDCTPFPGSVDECCNGVDDNGNTIVDEFACRCIDNGDCTGGGPIPSVCWSTTFQVCAPNCAFLGGDSFCSMIDPSLSCSMATGECTF